MRLGALVLSTLSLAGLAAAASPAPLLSKDAAVGGEQFEYQSDIARLMRVVVQHLYHDRDVFIRELLSNANDALEKTRLLSLTDASLLASAPNLNITVLPDLENGRIVIRDTGIGMTKKALQENLGTIARSGTSEFLEGLDKSATNDANDGGNLIGQFGLGFYSSFLVADKVTVASKSNDEATQHIFESQADAEGFSIAEDPRGNTLGRGTEITLWLKSDALEYLEGDRLRTLITKHSEYGSSPIFLWTETTVQEPAAAATPAEDGDEAKVEDETVETVAVVKSDWARVNDVAPLWMRDPKDVTDADYEEFYTLTFKEPVAPVSWTHFKGDAGSTSFRALIYLPSAMPNDFYSKTYVSLNSLKLFVRRVFITSDLGENFLPKWLNWVKVFVDADDLALNVGRDSLQKSRALSYIKKNLIKRTLDLFATLSKRDPEKYNSLYEKVGVSLKLGAVEDIKNRPRIVKLLRFETSASQNLTSLDDVVSRRKKGQEQIFYMAGVGQKKVDLEKSPFVERLRARGYEVLYFGEPMDEMIASSVGSYEGLKFQDVAKKGLKFGDEDDDSEAKEEEEALKTTFAPLADYLKKELSDSINEVVISTRLTTSPCLIVSDAYAWTGNMEKLMASQNSGTGENFMSTFMKTQKRTFEINPKHPLIEGLLEKVDEIEGDELAQAELRETVLVLWQTALVKSGFNVPDPNVYFEQVESLLRRSLGVSKSARARDLDAIKPAPPVETGPIRGDYDPTDDEAQVPKFEQPDEWANWADMKKGLKDAGEVVQDGAAAATEAIKEQVKVVVGGESHHDEL